METNGNKKMYITGVSAFVVGFVLSWLLFGLSGQSPSQTALPAEEGENSEFTANVAAIAGTADDSVSASNQPAGSTITVTVHLSQPRWIAIHEMADGIPARILGAQKFFSGDHTGTVALLRATVAGSTYTAMVHQDSGDSGFDLKTDMPLLSGGVPVASSPFTATVQ